MYVSYMYVHKCAIHANISVFEIGYINHVCHVCDGDNHFMIMEDDAFATL